MYKEERVRNRIYMIVVVALAAALGACVSTQTEGTTSGGGSQSSVDRVSPEAIENLSLEGVGDSVGKSIAFMPEGVLEITTGDGSFVGEWEYSTDPDLALLPLRISWMVGDEQHGYITTLMVDGDTYELFGYWYVTDRQISLTETYQVASE